MYSAMTSGSTRATVLFIRVAFGGFMRGITSECQDSDGPMPTTVTG
jgi:hypothetical protein